MVSHLTTFGVVQSLPENDFICVKLVQINDTKSIFSIANEIETLILRSLCSNTKIIAVIMIILTIM